MWIVSFYVNYLSYFRQWNLKSEYNFSLFIHIFKIEIFDCWSSFVLPSYSASTKRFWDFWMLLWLDLSIFPNSWKKLKIGYFQYKPVLYLQKFTNSLKSRKFGIFEVPSIPYIFDDSLSGTRRERGPNLWLNWRFSRKRNVHIFITILCQLKWG